MSRNYLEMTYKSIECFTNDGKLLVNELEQLLAIALKDDAVDDNEKRVLTNIFKRLNTEELTPEMLQKIVDIKKNHF